MTFLAAAIVLVLSVWFAGTLVSAVLSLADRMDARRLFLGCAPLASAATGAQVAVAPAGNAALALRVVAGAAMADVYPVGDEAGGILGAWRPWGR